MTSLDNLTDYNQHNIFIQVQQMNILSYQHQQQGLNNNQIISVHIMLWLNLLLMLLVNLRNENSRFFDPRQGSMMERPVYYTCNATH